MTFWTSLKKLESGKTYSISRHIFVAINVRNIVDTLVESNEMCVRLPRCVTRLSEVSGPMVHWARAVREAQLGDGKRNRLDLSQKSSFSSSVSRQLEVSEVSSHLR